MGQPAGSSRRSTRPPAWSSVTAGPAATSLAGCAPPPSRTAASGRPASTCSTACATCCPTARPFRLYQQASNLVDAYKTRRRWTRRPAWACSPSPPASPTAPRPSSAAAPTSSGARGLPTRRTHLSLDAVTAFRAGQVLPARSTARTAAGHYLVSAHLELEPGRAGRPGTWPPTPAATTRETVALRRRLGEAARGLAAPTSRPAVDRGHQEPAAQRGQRRRPSGPAVPSWATTSPTSCSTSCAAASSCPITTMTGTTSRASCERNRRGGRAPRRDLAGWPEVPSAPSCATAARATGDRTSSAWPTSTCRCSSAAATATPAAPGTSFSIRLRDRTAGGCSATRATGATSSRTGKVWRGRSPTSCPAWWPVRQRLHGGRLQPLPDHARGRRLGDHRPRRTPGATSATGATTRSSTC